LIRTPAWSSRGFLPVSVRQVALSDELGAFCP
jgi:hypothetical protein